MTVRAFVLLGGFFGPDGWVTSAPFLQVRSLLNAIPGVVCTAHSWDRFADVAAVKVAATDKVVVVGFSGGGSRATWLANLPSKPRIDLMVCYDPSPSWQMRPLFANVKRAITYQNSAPFFFGLGGGILSGQRVERVFISENHMAVQADQKLHARTVAEVRKLL